MMNRRKNIYGDDGPTIPCFVVSESRSSSTVIGVRIFTVSSRPVFFFDVDLLFVVLLISDINSMIVYYYT